MSNRQLTLLVIEDEKDLLEIYENYGQEVFGKVFTAGTLQEARKLFSEEHIDCLLIDNILPDGRGIEIVKEFELRKKGIPTIIITANPYKEVAIDAVNFGVHFFLQKPVGRLELLKIFEQCKYYLAKEENSKNWSDKFILPKEVEDHLRNVLHITQREMELISLALINLDNKSMADELKISVETVRKHFENIFKKLNLNSKKELRSLVYRIKEEKSLA